MTVAFTLKKTEPMMFYKSEIYKGWFCCHALFRFGPAPDDCERKWALVRSHEIVIA